MKKARLVDADLHIHEWKLALEVRCRLH